MFGKTRGVGATRWGIAVLVIANSLAGCQMGRAQRWETVSVELPASNEVFPPGQADAIANGQCLICHSAGMVLRQPPLSTDVWKAEIMKMRAAYGATIPVDQVDQLADYLHVINGR
jgi:mono/diheme cytochrome c family protein